RPVMATAGLNLSDRLILDYCAGAGTKTAQLAAMHPEARIVATDRDPRRFDLLKERFRGHDRVEVRDIRDLLDYAQAVDLLVLDVPCSNTGVLPRRIEAKYRLDDQHLKKLTDVQKQIVADSLVYRRPGGWLLYSSCSIESEENERQVAWINKWHRT